MKGLKMDQSVSNPIKPSCPSVTHPELHGITGAGRSTNPRDVAKQSDPDPVNYSYIYNMNRPLIRPRPPLHFCMISQLSSQITQIIKNHAWVTSKHLVLSILYQKTIHSLIHLPQHMC